MGTPRVCLFDLGDVAARFVPDRRMPELARLLGAEPAEITRVVWDSGLSARFDRGEFDLEGMARELSGSFSAPVATDELARVWCLAFELDDAVLEIARKVAERCATGLLTNNPPALEAGLPTHLPRLHEVFEPVLFSSSLGAAKPEPALFEAAERATACAPAELALIDDSRKNVDAARARGWASIRFTDAESLRRELAERGWIL